MYVYMYACICMCIFLYVQIIVNMSECVACILLVEVLRGHDECVLGLNCAIAMMTIAQTNQTQNLLFAQSIGAQETM